jgi:hypothetical protein
LDKKGFPTRVSLFLLVKLSSTEKVIMDSGVVKDAVMEIDATPLKEQGTILSPICDSQEDAGKASSTRH